MVKMPCQTWSDTSKARWVDVQSGCQSPEQPITSVAARTEVGQAHEHTFANPDGFQFHVGCFARATGCASVGEPSTYWSWFAGYSWQVELCSACREHLGWLFRNEGHAFHCF